MARDFSKPVGEPGAAGDIQLSGDHSEAVSSVTVNSADIPNILIVDDNPNNLHVLCGILEKEGYRVRPAINGQIALKTAKNLLPDLVLLDIRMPEMSGYIVCEKLKSDPLTANVPVIFISAMDDVEDKIKAFQAGGVDYITKPFQFTEVLARVKSQLNLRQFQLQLEQKNQALAQRTRELQAVNKELESFSYMTSGRH